MSTTIADRYYIKARDSYGYDNEECLEYLEYALGYDDMHSGANFIMGLLNTSYLYEFDEAANCFDRVISSNAQFVDVYGVYAALLIKLGQLKRAENLISYAETVPGVCLGMTNYKLAMICEADRKYKKAIRLMKAAKLEVSNLAEFNFIDSEIKRVKKKVKKKKVGAISYYTSNYA